MDKSIAPRNKLLGVVDKGKCYNNIHSVDPIFEPLQNSLCLPPLQEDNLNSVPTCATPEVRIQLLYAICLRHLKYLAPFGIY